MSEATEPSKEPNCEKPKWSRVQSMKLPVSQFRKVYQSAEEVEKARREGTFDIMRTMVLKNGRLFFLCTQ